MKRIASLLAAAVVLAAPVGAAARDTADTKFEKAVAGRVAGAPVRCISLGGITSSQIIDGKAIIYRVGSKVYVNQPRSGADQLDDRDVLLTRNVGTQLCGADTVQLIDSSSRAIRSFVVLGDFVPYTRTKAS